MVGPLASRSVALLVFPLLIWATVRFGQRGATAAAAFVSAAAVVGTAMGYGPFLSGALHERLWTLQAYLIVMVVTLLVLGAVTEERLRAVAALRRALDAREEFLSIASHELKTPLSAMVLNLSGLQRALRRGEPISADNVGQKVERVVRQTGRLTALINQLLDVSRILSARSARARDVDYTVHATCAVASRRGRAGGTGAAVTGTPRLRGHGTVCLEQVLRPIVNAIRYGEGPDRRH
jgi:signal transduction histidine kinase